MINGAHLYQYVCDWLTAQGARPKACVDHWSVIGWYVWDSPAIGYVAIIPIWDHLVMSSERQYFVVFLFGDIELMGHCHNISLG